MARKTIFEFQAHMKNFMRPNKFEVRIGRVKASKQRTYAISCFQAQLPGNTIATTDKDIGFRSVAYQTVYSDIILGFYCDEKMKALKYWQHWIEKIHNRTTNQWAYHDDYVSEINIVPINRSDHNVATWTLHDAYPKQVDPIQLDYGTNDSVMTVNVTITYRNFDVVWENLVNQKAVETNDAEPQYAIDTDTDLEQTNIKKSYENLKATYKHETPEEFMKRMRSDGTYDYANDPTTKEAIAKRAREGGALHSIVGE